MDMDGLDRRLKDIEASVSAVLLCLDNPETSSALPVPGKAITDHSIWRLCARESHLIEVRRTLFPRAAHTQAGWNMFMAANLARIENRALAVTDLAILSLSPPTTALRHLELLTDAGLLIREQDLADARRRYISLSDWGTELMVRYAVEVLTQGRRRRPLRRVGSTWREA